LTEGNFRVEIWVCNVDAFFHCPIDGRTKSKVTGLAIYLPFCGITRCPETKVKGIDDENPTNGMRIGRFGVQVVLGKVFNVNYPGLKAVNYLKWNRRIA
jgi:hypothetical protein